MRPASVIELLEVRSLLSVSAGLPADAAAEAPSVRLISRSLVTTGTSHTFHLVVTSSAGLSPAAVGDDDVLVSGPKGFAAPASVVGVATSTDGTRQIVTCRVAAPGGTFDRSDNGVYRVAVRDGGIVDDAGEAAPGGVIGGFRVFARRLQPAAALPTLPIPASASAGALTATLTSVNAWCDHMPGFWPEPDNRQYLVATTVLRNTSDQPLEVKLDQAFVSFDENQLGTPTDGISVKSPSGPPSGVKTVVLQPGESRTVVFRGNGVYPEGRHGQRLYLTLQFTAGDATLAVRSSAVVAVTY